MKNYVCSFGALMGGGCLFALLLMGSAWAAPAANDIGQQQMSDLAKLQALPTGPTSASSAPSVSPPMGEGNTPLGFGRLTPGAVQASPLGPPASTGVPPISLPNVPPTVDGLAPASTDMGMQSPFAVHGTLAAPSVAGGGVSAIPSSASSSPESPSDSYQHNDGVLTLHNAVQVVRFADPKISGVWCYLIGPKIADNLLTRTRSGGNIAPHMTINCIVRPGVLLPEDLPGVEPVDSFSSDSFVVDRVWDASTRALLYVVLDLNRTADGVPLASSTILSLGDVHTTPHSMFEP